MLPKLDTEMKSDSFFFLGTTHADVPTGDSPAINVHQVPGGHGP